MPLLEQEMSDRHEEGQQPTIPVHTDRAVTGGVTPDSVAAVVVSTGETTKGTVGPIANTTTAVSLSLRVDTTVGEASKVVWA